MAWFPTLRAPDRLNELRREGKQIVWDLLDVEVPIVCALNGPAVGLGASIALLCDVIVMAHDAIIRDPHVQVGLVAGDGGAAIWPLLLGPLAAKRHLMLGVPLGAAEAVRLGVASEACGADEVLDVAHRWADLLAAQPPLAVQGTKLAVNAQIKQALLSSFDLSTALEIGLLPLRRPRRSGQRVRRQAPSHVPREMTMTQRATETTDGGDDDSEPQRLDPIEAIMTTRAIRRFTDEPVTDEEIADLPARRPAGSERGQRPGAAVRGRHRCRDRRPTSRTGTRCRSIGTGSRCPIRRASATRRPAASWTRTRDASQHLADHIQDAAAIVFFLQPIIPWGAVDDEGAMDIGRLDASIYPAVQNFCVAARSLGIGTALTTVIRIHAAETLAALGVPANDDGSPRFEIAACVPMGRPVGNFGVAPRKPAAAVTHWNTFGNRRRDAERP